MQVLECKKSGKWSPCRGTPLDSHENTTRRSDGDEYCHEQYEGPLCEVCVLPGYFFSDSDARCYKCNDTGAYAGIATALLFGAIAAAVVIAAMLWHQKLPKQKHLRKCVKLVRKTAGVWRGAGMRNKFKIFFGLNQVISAKPSAFSFDTPDSLKGLTAWLEWSSMLGLDVVIPARCIGSYQQELLVSTLWPFGFLLIVIACCMCYEVMSMSSASWRTCSAHGVRAAVRAGLQRSLPLTLLLTFLLLPSAANRIFNSFLCDPYNTDDDVGDNLQRFYSRDDPSVDCSTDTYFATKHAALGLVALWPVGETAKIKLE